MHIAQVRDYRRRELPKLEVECAPALVASSRAKFQVILTIIIIIAINMIINIAIIECAPALVVSSRAMFQVIIIFVILVIFIPVIIIIIICTLFTVIPVILLVINLPVNTVSFVRRKISESS